MGEPLDTIYDLSHAKHNHITVKDKESDDITAVLNSIDNIVVAPGHSSVQGIIHVFFDDTIHYAKLVDEEIQIDSILVGEHYETIFTAHWEK